MKRQAIAVNRSERRGRHTAVLNLYDKSGKGGQKSVALGIPVRSGKNRAPIRPDPRGRDPGSPERRPDPVQAESPPFADFLWSWLEIVAPTIERTTYRSYESIISARLDPFFRSRRLRLCDVEPRHIRELHASIFQDGCNANTVIHYHAVVRKALQYAVKNEMLTENPADKVDRPKKGKFLAGFYSKEELADLFEVTREDSMSIVIQLAAYYGLRRSEVLGVRWSAVDFDRGTICINHKVTESSSGGKYQLYAEDKLKNKSSFRTLPLIPAVRELLLEQRERQARFQAMFRSSYCADYLDYICVDELGNLFRPNYVTDHFRLLLRRHKLRPIRFHDLRHSCASLLLSQGIPMKQIQDWLGHSTFATTADIYSHLDFNSKQASANAIAAAFGAAQGQQT